MQNSNTYCATSIYHVSIGVQCVNMLHANRKWPFLGFVFSLMLPLSATVRLTPVTSDFLFSTTRLPCLYVNVMGCSTNTDVPPQNGF